MTVHWFCVMADLRPVIYYVCYVDPTQYLLCLSSDCNFHLPFVDFSLGGFRVRDLAHVRDPSSGCLVVVYTHTCTRTHTHTLTLTQGSSNTSPINSLTVRNSLCIHLSVLEALPHITTMLPYYTVAFAHLSVHH